MAKANELSGLRFGRLAVLERAGSTANGVSKWKCVCDCGNVVTVTCGNLKNGHTKSCGCLVKEKAKETHTTHGQGATSLYSVWRGMLERCYDENNRYYKNYGFRGIAVCEEWRTDFQIFYDWAIANGYKKGLSIDRKDANGEYAPHNCRFVTMKVQQNNRTNNRLVTFDGKTMTVAEWSEATEIPYKTLYNRLYKGMPIELALTKGVKK